VGPLKPSNKRAYWCVPEKRRVLRDEARKLPAWDDIQLKKTSSGLDDSQNGS